MTTSSDPELIYCDDALLVVNKPAGMLAVPGRGPDKQNCLSAHIQKTYPDALIVHRLDMATSGLIVFARGAAMQRKLSRLFHDRKVLKRYTAVVGGRLEESGEIDLPLMADWPNRPKQKVDHAGGKHSLTRYRPLAYDAASDTSRVELEPVTGRTHQLRVHLAAIGHPIVGDALYGVRPAGRLYLHASTLSFVHPLGSQLLCMQCETPF
jgi:tRNA pseudouridine32 synthase/23S rRNA pseudouridine746 synthase